MRGIKSVVVGIALASGAWTARGQDSCPTLFPPQIAIPGSGRGLVQGAAPFDHAGFAVADAGDVDGDGLSDVVVCAPDADPANRSGAGRVYVISGAALLAQSGPISLADFDADLGRRVDGPAAGALLGSTAGGIGDFNADGFADIAITAPGIHTTYVLFGRADAPDTLDLADLTRGDGLRIPTPGPVTSLAAAGDVNGDGFDDILFGLPGTTVDGLFESGMVWVVYGGALDLSASAGAPPELTDLTTTQIPGRGARHRLGTAVVGAGDLDGDGFDDVVLGAPGAGGDSGEITIVQGRDTLVTLASLDLESLTPATGRVIAGVVPGGTFGHYLAGGGDLDGDGRFEVIVGSVDRLDILYRPLLGITTGLAVDSFAASTVAQIMGATGAIVAGADLNGDGYDDLLTRRGAVFGDPDRNPAPLDQLNGDRGFQFSGSASAGIGRSVAWVRDLDGDGTDDALIGADFATGPAGTAAGSATLIFGRVLDDCNGNGTHDPCEADCNSNGVPDECDTRLRTSLDCNGNDIPDECESQDDCNDNGDLDICELDSDQDGTIDDCDACPANSNKALPGSCGCDVNDDDTDGDGVADCVDRCPGFADRFDADSDGVPDACDNCPNAPNSAQFDSNADGVGDACGGSGDLDGDFILDITDNCPRDPNVGQEDIDGDGIGDACDTDDDGDGVADTSDACAATPLGTVVTDQGCPAVSGPAVPPGSEVPDVAVSIASSITENADSLEIGYTITVSNVGNVVARSVALEVSLTDSSGEVVEASNGAMVVDGRLVWPSFDLAVSATVTRSYAVRLPTDAISLDGVVSVVEVDSDDNDSNPSNNSDRDVVPGNRPPVAPLCGAAQMTTLALTMAGLGWRRRRRINTGAHASPAALR